MSKRFYYSIELAARICDRISDGESVRAICRDPEMPSKTSVFEWLAEYPEFATMYAAAKDECADTYADEIVEIADEYELKELKGDDGQVRVVYDGVAVARNRLRVDARKWIAGKLKPKKYGDRIGLDHSGNIQNMTDERLNARLSELLGKAGVIGASGGSGEAEGEA